jgi:hypothetical protein
MKAHPPFNPTSPFPENPEPPSSKIYPRPTTRRSKRLRGDTPKKGTVNVSLVQPALGAVSPTPNSKLDTMPLDVILHIAHFLTRNDLLKTIRICRCILKSIQPLVYRTIDCSRLPQDSLEQVALMLSQRPDLAKAVRSLVVERQPPVDVSISYAKNSLQGVLKDTLNTRILKSCSNVKSLVMKGPCELAMASHLQLERLCISHGSSTRRVLVDLSTIDVHKNLMDLEVGSDCVIRNGSIVKLGDLPKLRSVSGTDEVLMMFGGSRPVENFNLVIAEGDLSNVSASLALERWIMFSQAIRISSVPIRRLQIEIPSSVSEDWTLQTVERVVVGLDSLENLRVICGAVSPLLVSQVVRYDIKAPN